MTTAGTGLKGLPIDQVIEKFFGDIRQWPTEPDGRNFTQAQIRAICEHINKTGDCLWHAQAIVMKWPICHCARCNGPTKEENI